MRELGLIDDDGGLDGAFADIDELATGCRFSDCRHEREPGCAVRGAIDDGSLEASRLTSRRKLERELARTERQVDPRVRAERRRQHRLLRNAVGQHMKLKYGDDR